MVLLFWYFLRKTINSFRKVVLCQQRLIRLRIPSRPNESMKLLSTYKLIPSTQNSTNVYYLKFVEFWVHRVSHAWVLFFPLKKWKSKMARIILINGTVCHLYNLSYIQKYWKNFTQWIFFSKSIYWKGWTVVNGFQTFRMNLMICGLLRIQPLSRFYQLCKISLNFIWGYQLCLKFFPENLPLWNTCLDEIRHYI